MKEIEVRFLNIDTKELGIKLKKIKAKKIYSTIFRITAFEGPTKDSRDFIRIRDEGDKITLTHKITVENSATAVENTIFVNSYQDAVEFIKSLGFKQQRIDEKHRIHY